MGEEQPKQVTEVQVTWAYSVIDSYIEAFKKVTVTTNQTEKYTLAAQLNQDFIESMPKLCEAFVILTNPEHRPIIFSFFRAYAEVFESWKKPTSPA